MGPWRGCVFIIDNWTYSDFASFLGGGTRPSPGCDTVPRTFMALYTSKF